jgi:sarcosine oxidase
MFKYVVIGKGMIGSAAAKYLSAASDSVAVIGIDEPTDFKKHNGVFASHYDSGRITRILDSDYTWGLAAQRSIQMYPVIEEKSGIKFFNPAGCIKVVPDSPERRTYIEVNESVGSKLGAKSQRLTAEELGTQYPYLNFPTGSIGIAESVTAGWINPRKLVEAQLVLAKQNDAQTINDTVIGISREDNILTVKTLSGQKHQTEKVIVAAGGFTNFNNLLSSEIDLTARAETIVQARVGASQLQTFRNMPSIIWFLEDHEKLDYVYVVPPVQYPDGNFYIKMGGNREANHTFATLEELNDWFHSDGGQEGVEVYQKLIQQMLPSLMIEQWISKPCVITDTVTEKPYIDIVEEGIYIATGGCGAAAKSSDEFGRLAALCAQGQHDPAYDKNAFKVIFKGQADDSGIEKRKFHF